MSGAAERGEQREKASDRIVGDLTDIPAADSYLKRIGAEPRSLTGAVVRVREGRYSRDLATIKFDKATGAVMVKAFGEAAAEEFEPTEAEKAALAEDFPKVCWPEVLPLARIIDPPKMIAEADKKDIHPFRDRQGQIQMVQVRIDTKDGGKAYVPWTYWSDNRWRQCEPDGLLPLYNEDKLNDCVTVFVHEGAKAARRMQEMIEAGTREARDALKAHPWGEQLSGVAHVGWIGGALSPHRTNWKALADAGVTRVYIVNDNDDPGRRAVKKISRELARWKISVVNICVSQEHFPDGWDLGDDMPTDGDGNYIGEPMMSYAVPATYLTRKVPKKPGERGAPRHELREVATQDIVPIRKLDCFAYRLNGVIRDADELDREQAPYAGVKKPAGLFWTDVTHGSVSGLTYRPDLQAEFVQEGDERKFNPYRPSPVVAVKSNLGQWFEYLEYMFAEEGDRREVERWIATLIGRPGTRMTYSLLLVSALQGKGKSTLYDKILRPLVGMNNSALVTSKAMDSEFNDWAAQKRLAVCHEIYESGNWRLADRLKTVTTEERLAINEKYKRPYELPNWIVIAAASNDERALALSSQDRRWLVPKVDESVIWPIEKFAAFRRWLATGGLSAIKHWAENYPDEYVPAGAHAPMTEAKREAIENSRSRGMVAALAMAGQLGEWEKPGAVSFSGLMTEARRVMPNCPDSVQSMAREAVAEGLTRFADPEGGDRVKIVGKKERLLLNSKAVEALAETRLNDTETLADAQRKAVRVWAEEWSKRWNDMREVM